MSETPEDVPDSGAELSVIEPAKAIEAVKNIALPASIKSNLLKAADRLTGAIVDLPAAYLEGLAAEIRANSSARVEITKSVAEKVLTGVAVPEELSSLALRRHAGKILREQRNVDAVLAGALPHLIGQQSESDQEPAEIDGDWLNVFEKEAAVKSNEEMQQLLSRILAGEIRHPSSFSMKAVRTVAQLDPYVAKLFLRLCSISISKRRGNASGSAMVVSFIGDPATNALKEYGLNYDSLSTLNEYGLVDATFHVHHDYEGAIPQNNQLDYAIHYGNRRYFLKPVSASLGRIPFRFEGVNFTKVGNELLRIVDAIVDDRYSEALFQHVRQRGFEMVPTELG